MSDFNASPDNTPQGGDITPSAPAPTSVGSAPQIATPSAPSQTPATGDNVDRSTWVPPHRIRETREQAYQQAQREAQTQMADMQRQADLYRTQLHSLVGVTPPANPEMDAIRSQFSQVYPGLSKLEEKAQELLGMIDRGGEIDNLTSHHWAQHAQTSVSRLYSLAEQTLGSPLSAEGKDAIHRQFSGYVQSSPDMLERYVNDPGFVDNYWKFISSTLIDPVRRSAVSAAAGRAPGNLPQDSPGGAPRVPQAPQPANLDDRISQGWGLYNQNKRQ